VVKLQGLFALSAAAALISLGACSSKSGAPAPSPSPSPFSQYDTTIVGDSFGAWRNPDGLVSVVAKSNVDMVFGSRDSQDVLDAGVRAGKAIVLEYDTHVTVLDSRDEPNFLNQEKWQACQVRLATDRSVWWVDCESLASQSE
jgi:hypothetical protein